jgi:calcineurin-like phosphoesterase family protein
MNTPVFFTSDHHFKHTNMIKYTKRPFLNTEEMDEYLIKQWNDTVPEHGIVHHLGDFAITGYSMSYIAEVDSLLNRLNGKKFLYMGNHDAPPVRKSNGWVKTNKLKCLTIQKQKIILCHYPLRTWQFKAQSSWMLHGHCHGNLPPPANELTADVGVDSDLGKAFGMAPIPFEFLKDEWFST